MATVDQNGILFKNVINRTVTRKGASIITTSDQETGGKYVYDGWNPVIMGLDIDWNGADLSSVLGSEFSSIQTTGQVLQAIIKAAQMASATAGPQGPQGTKGPQGVQGPAGLKGAQGAEGIQGARGPQGAQGAQGTNGATGARGAQGPQGSAGAQGPKGTTGVQGPTGVQGSIGPQGSRGQAGVQGAQGHQGSRGITGAQGATGSQGLPGSQGARGITGAQGYQGYTGPKGDQGPQGAQGKDGAQGATGATGAQGSKGAVGPQGPKGSAPESSEALHYIPDTGITTYYQENKVIESITVDSKGHIISVTFASKVEVVDEPVLETIAWKSTAQVETNKGTRANLGNIVLTYSDNHTEEIAYNASGVTLSNSTYYNTAGTYNLKATYQNKTTTNSKPVKVVEQTQYYYYVGPNNPMDMDSIDPIVTDRTQSGWYHIGTSVGSYTAGNPLYDASDNMIALGSKTYDYIALPNATLAVYDGLGNNGFTDGSYTKLGTKAIGGVTYHIYKDATAIRNFSQYIY